MKAGRRAITLLELLISIILVSFVFLVVSESLSYTIKQVSVLAERYTMYSQVSYALDDLVARSQGAAQIAAGSFFSPSGGSLQEFGFFGERDVSNITPDNLNDNVWYHYFIDPASGALVRETDNADREVLVEGKFSPGAAFEYRQGDEPNLMVVTLNATSKRYKGAHLARTMAKMGTIRFWFVNIVR